MWTVDCGVCEYPMFHSFPLHAIENWECCSNDLSVFFPPHFFFLNYYHSFADAWSNSVRQPSIAHIYSLLFCSLFWFGIGTFLKWSGENNNLLNEKWTSNWQNIKMRCIFIVVGRFVVCVFFSFSIENIPRWDFYTHANFKNMVINKTLWGKRSLYFNHSKTIRFNLNQIMSAALFLSSHSIIICFPWICGQISDSKVAFEHKQKCQVPRIIWNYFLSLYQN